jgi:guanylate kinase
MAGDEIQHYKDYDYLIVNEDLGVATKELQSIVLSSRCRISARIDSAKSILATFGGMDAKDP